MRTLRALFKLMGSNTSTLLAAAPRDEFLLLSVAVDPRATERSAGTELVRGFEEAVRGVTEAYRLNVVKTNITALRFYKRLAFQQVGETPTAWTLRKVLTAKAPAADLRAARQR